MPRAPALLPPLLLVAAACAGCSTARGHGAAAADPPAVEGEVWIYRDLLAGVAGATATLDTYRLVLDGDRATLEVITAVGERADPDADLAGGAWETTGTRTFLGTVTPDGDARIVELREAGSELLWRWSCAPHTHQVAPADAVPAPSADDRPCDEPVGWSRPTRPVDVLACGDLADDDPELLEGIFAFGPAPGIEHLVVDADCLSGGGLRAIAPGGGIAPIR